MILGFPLERAKKYGLQKVDGSNFPAVKKAFQSKHKMISTVYVYQKVDIPPVTRNEVEEKFPQANFKFWCQNDTNRTKICDFHSCFVLENVSSPQIHQFRCRSSRDLNGKVRRPKVQPQTARAAQVLNTLKFKKLKIINENFNFTNFVPK